MWYAVRFSLAMMYKHVLAPSPQQCGYVGEYMKDRCFILDFAFMKAIGPHRVIFVVTIATGYEIWRKGWEGRLGKVYFMHCREFEACCWQGTVYVS